MTPTQRPVLLPRTVASILEAWMHEKCTGYVQLNFNEGTIGNATIHCTVPVKGHTPNTSQLGARLKYENE